MLLEGKNAVIYGVGGAIGGAVARAFAREGVKVFLAGRTLAKVEAVAGRSPPRVLGRQEDWEEPKGRATDARCAIPDFSS